MKFDKLKVGMVIYDVQPYKMGNTTIRTIGTCPVRIKEIDADRRRALASWNGNQATWLSEAHIAKLKEKKPILIRTPFGAMRRPTREELAEIRAKEKAKKASTAPTNNQGE